MTLALVAALFANLKTQQPNEFGNFEIASADAVAASAEFDAWKAAQPVALKAPKLPVWTTVKVKAGEHAGKVGTVCGGDGDSIQVDFEFNPAIPPITENVSNLQKL